MSSRQPWFEVTQALVDVAMGRKAADLVILKGSWVNVHSGEIIPDTDVAIVGFGGAGKGGAGVGT